MELPAPPLDRLRGLTKSPINSHNDVLWNAISRIKRETKSELLAEVHLWPEPMRAALTRICGDIAGRLGYTI